MKTLPRILISTTILLTLACLSQQWKPDALEDYLLPTDLTPLEYDIHITPYLEIPSDRNFTFDGRLTILIGVNVSTDVIKMHAYNMSIVDKSIVITNVNNENIVGVSNWDMADNDTHFFNIKLDSYLLQDNLYTIQMDYKGVLNDDLDGFYRSYYNDSNGNKKWLAVTLFAPTGARRAFPCWDEPGWKAKFTFHIAHAPDYDVIANMPVEGPETPVENDPELESWTWTHFQQSERMSTYIVTFCVNQFESIVNTEDPRFQVWARPEAKSQGHLANDLAPAIVDYMQRFTKHDYALPKMDQVAIPDFAANAMENWGIITYRETALLFTAGVSTSYNRHRVETIVTHELAHQWFGDLVTPVWWSNVWLSEGFATYFEYHALDSVHPDWQLPEQFVQLEMHKVLQGDALETTHPLLVTVDSTYSANAVFDDIAYNKGACMVRMLVSLMGEENFKTGINNYLEERKFGNAHMDDLWRLLQPSVPEGVLPEGSDLKKVMDTWTLQSGYPVITVTRDYLENTAKVAQERFLTLRDPEIPHEEKWDVPLTLTSPDDLEVNDPEVTWLTEVEMEMTDLPASDKYLLFNVKQIGYYRVNYDPRNWALLHAALNSPQMSDIHVINRAQLTDDALALARAGLLDYPTALDTTAYLAMETEYVPWSAALTALGYVGDRLAYETEHRELFQWYVLDKLQHMYELVGGLNVGSNDSHVLRLTRALVLEWTCAQGHMECRSKTTTLFKQWQNDPEDANPIDPDLRNVVYCSGMRAGGDEEFSFLFGRYENASLLASEQTVILSALGCSSDTALLESYLQESIKEGSVIRPHDARSAITAVYNNYLGVDIALDFLLENFEQASKVYGGFGAIGKVFSGLSAKLNTQEHKNKLAKFRDDNLEGLGTALVSVEAAIVTVQESLSWHQLHRTTVLEYLGDKRGDSGASTLTIGGLLLMLTLAMTLA